MKENVNILVGRFQPITNGHLKCAEYIYSRYKMKTVLCIVESRVSNERHPFSTDIVRSIIESIREPYIAGVIVIKNAFIGLVAEAMQDNYPDYIISCWSCGTDRYDRYHDMLYKYNYIQEYDNIDKDIKLVEIKRSDEDISATKARELIYSMDINNLKKIVPPAVVKRVKVLRTLIDKTKPTLKNKI